MAPFFVGFGMLAAMSTLFRVCWSCLVMLIWLWAVPAEARGKPPIEYEISVDDPESQYVDVVVTVDKSRKRATDLAMPAWTPGSYLIRDFARHVYGWRAESLDGQPLAVSRTDKQTWRVENRRKPFRFRYRVWADDLGVRTNYVDDRFAFLNGAGLFVYVVGELERPTQLRIKTAGDWPVHTTLPRDDDGFATQGYDELVDNPLLLGAAETRQFKVDGTTFDYVFLAPGGSNADVDRLAGDAEKIVTAAGEVMGGFPFSRYAFLIVADPVGGGGLEHATSTGIVIPPFIFDSDDGYERAQGVASHEFFHAWNVKRIHDRVLGPFDYSQEAYSDLLWFHEGVTSTMTPRLLVRAGLQSREKYLDKLAKSWTKYLRQPGRNAEPVAQISRDAWIKGYQPSKNHRNDSVSYYSKGALVGVALDLELRARSAKHGKKGSLEGLFKRLWEGRKKGAADRPITTADLVTAASEEAGEDMQPFFDAYVLGRKELPLPGALEGVGVKAVSQKPDESDAKTWSGIVGGGSTIDSVDPDSPADRAGLMIDDELIAVDGARVRSLAQAKRHLEAKNAGSKASVTLFRRGRLLQRELTMAENPHETWSFEAAAPTWPPAP